MAQSREQRTAKNDGEQTRSFGLLLGMMLGRAYMKVCPCRHQPAATRLSTQAIVEDCIAVVNHIVPLAWQNIPKISRRVSLLSPEAAKGGIFACLLGPSPGGQVCAH